MCQEFCGKSFPEAVNYLLDFNGHRARDSPNYPLPRPEPRCWSVCAGGRVKGVFFRGSGLGSG